MTKALCQFLGDAFFTLVPLYTTVSVAWRNSAALIQAAPVATDNPAIRSSTADALTHITSLSIQAYGFSRAGDAAQLLVADIPGLGMERNNRLNEVSYHFPLRSCLRRNRSGFVNVGRSRRLPSTTTAVCFDLSAALGGIVPSMFGGWVSNAERIFLHVCPMAIL